MNQLGIFRNWAITGIFLSLCIFNSKPGKAGEKYHSNSDNTSIERIEKIQQQILSLQNKVFGVKTGVIHKGVGQSVESVEADYANQLRPLKEEARQACASLSPVPEKYKSLCIIFRPTVSAMSISDVVNKLVTKIGKITREALEHLRGAGSAQE